MPLFNWPYTNLHNLNLDWIINKIKNVETAEINTAASEEAAAGSAANAAASETNAALYETNAAGSATAAAGSAEQAQALVDQLDTTIAQDVADWLDEHITPTTPAIDYTLTVSGAAADAKVTGNRVTDLKYAFDEVVNQVSSINLFDKSNSNMILPNKSMSATGEVISNDSANCIRIPINSAGTYTYITQNTTYTGFVVRTTRIAGYNAGGNVVEMYSNNTTGTVSISGADIANGVCWLYIYAGNTATIEQLDIMVIKDWDGSIPTSYIPYLVEYYLKSDKLDTPIPDTSNIITKYISSNVFNLNDTDLIISNSTLDPSGNIIQSDSSSVIKIPVYGIDGIGYNLYRLNTNRTGYIAAQARWVMYGQNGQNLGVIVNNTRTPAIITSPDCKYLYCNCVTESISSGEVMVLTNASGIYISNYSFIPYLKKDIFKTQWDNKVFGLYGDSISAICNGNLKDNGWFRFVNYVHNFSRLYGRSIGGQRFAWGTAGGAVAFVSAVDGNYNGRNDSYTKDNYTGEVPEGCVKIRSAFCSWDRITKMFPLSIKDSIDVVYIMGGTNDANDNSALAWVANDTTDPEWAASDYYATYSGDYNISTLRGGVASTIMKMQAWMPNAIIIIGTPLNGQTNQQGSIRPDYVPDEYDKSIVIKDAANKYGCPVIDVFGTCGINTLNSPRYITDGTHPYSEAGLEMLARSVTGGLKMIYPTL